MSAGEAIFWTISALLWIFWIAWIIADAIEGTRAGRFMDKLWDTTTGPITRTTNRALQRITATRK